MESPTPTDVLNMSLYDIRMKMNDPEVGYSLGSGDIYIRKIESMNNNERSSYCLLMAEAVHSAIKSKQRIDVEPQLYKALIDISRSGLNAIYENMKGQAPKGAEGVVYYNNDFNGNPDDAHLYSPFNYFIALGHNGYDRPYEALNCLNKAIADYSSLIDSFEKASVPVNDMKIDLADYKKLRIRIWMDIVEGLDKKKREDAYKIVIKSMLMLSKELWAIGETKDAEAYKHQCSIYAMNKKVKLSDAESFKTDIKKIVDDENISYQDWCWINRYWLTPMNEFIDIPRQEWMSDDIGWKTSEDNVIRINDIMRTYNHCRMGLYEFTRTPRMERAREIEDDSFDRLLDCYLRLYSIIDKTMKLIATDILHGAPDKEIKFWELQKNEKFTNKQKNCKDLKFITDLCWDMSVDEKDRDRGFIDSFYTIHRVKLPPGVIRNLAIHSAVKIIDSNQKDRKWWDNIVVISPIDLEVEVKKLMLQVRELLLGLQKAMMNGAGKLPDELEKII